MMHGLTRWFIHNPVGANLLMVAMLVGGGLALEQLRVETFPQIAPSALIVTVAYPGGTAQQIDEGITQRIEESVSGIAGIKQIISESSSGMATVRIQKTANTDLDKLLEDVRNRVNAIIGFPDRAERPKIQRDAFTNLAAYVIISGDKSNRILQPIARRVEMALKKNPNISKVDNLGHREPLLIVEPDPARLRSLGLSLKILADRIAQMSLELRSGELKSSRGRIIVRGDTYADDIQKLRDLTVIARPSGQITLGDLATIRRDYEENSIILRNNGHNAIVLQISTSEQDNLLQVSRAIRETLAVQRQRLPEDVQLSVMADMAPYIADQLERLGKNAWQGLLIVLLLLGLFLELKLAFWVALGIPVAVSGTFVAMDIMNYSLNDITLFGFILVLGILVDDAVVVGESIDSARRHYPDPHDAAWYGVHSVSIATVFGVLTTIAAFSPMLWIDNVLAKVLASFSAVVIFALLFSLLESKFVLPAHLANERYRLWQPHFVSRIQAFAQNGLTTFNRRFYRAAIVASLRRKPAVFLGLAAFVVLAYGMWVSGIIPSAVFPNIPGRYLSVNIELQEGAPLPLQKKALTQMESVALHLNDSLKEKYQLDEKPLINLLAWSNSYGKIRLTMETTNEALTKIPANEILTLWRKLSGPVEGGYSISFAASDDQAGGTVISVVAADRQLARQAAQALSEKLSALPGVADVFNDGKGGQEQIRIRLNRYGRQLGLTQESLARLAGEAFGQRDVNRVLENGQEVKLVVRYADQQKLTLDQLRHTPVILSEGQSVALGDVATLSFESQPEVLYRRNRDPVVNIFWQQNRDIQSPEQTLKQLTETIQTLERQYRVTIKPAGEFDNILEVQSGFKYAMIVTLLLIYVLLAIPLKSYWQPLLIMAVIPFGFAGAIFGHYLLGLQISILSMFGMMAMTGIVINDSLVLITRFNDYYRAGMPLNKALIKTGTSRLRAVFLTTITTVCGLLPLLSETAEQAQYLKPAAVSLVFGELFATTVTLILIPVLLGGVMQFQTKLSVR
jgi:multidrug efflux pump subunit AcrB